MAHQTTTTRTAHGSFGEKGRPASDGDTITLVCIAGSPPAFRNGSYLRRWVRPHLTSWKLQEAIRRAGVDCHWPTGKWLATVVPVVLLVNPTCREYRWHLLRRVAPGRAVIRRGRTHAVSQIHEPLPHTRPLLPHNGSSGRIRREVIHGIHHSMQRPIVGPDPFVYGRSSVVDPATALPLRLNRVEWRPRSPATTREHRAAVHNVGACGAAALHAGETAIGSAGRRATVRCVVARNRGRRVAEPRCWPLWIVPAPANEYMTQPSAAEFSTQTQIWSISVNPFRSGVKEYNIDQIDIDTSWSE